VVIKVLFFDTSALLKKFVSEDGTHNVKWLTSAETKVCHSLHFVINQQVCTEFENKLRHFAKNGKLTTAKADKILDRFNRHHKDRDFKIIGQSIISNTKSETDLHTVNERLNLKPGKNDWDGLIFQSIVNALAFLGGQSHPILVTCDGPFGKKVGACGYRVVNPMQQTVDEMLGIIQS
jgi:predicted nucleic acid-binding protein